MATITIPAAYIEDAQRALTYEIREDGEILDGNRPRSDRARRSSSSGTCSY